MDQLTRIREMEQIFKEASASLARLSDAWEEYAALAPQLAQLEAYYISPQWRADYEADEAGLLPPDLPRGVLSQDGVYDLLALRDQLLRQITASAQKEDSDETIADL